MIPQVALQSQQAQKAAADRQRILQQQQAEQEELAREPQKFCLAPKNTPPAVLLVAFLGWLSDPFKGES